MDGVEPDEVAPEPPYRDADAILAVELRQAFRGYHLGDVDAVLGELALQVRAMEAELARLRAGAEREDPTRATTPEVAPSAAEPAVARQPDEGRTPSDVTVPTDDEPPRETLGVASGARRRALVPSMVLTLGSAIALAVGWFGEDGDATRIAIAGSVLALVGVGLAVWRTRERSTV